MRRRMTDAAQSLDWLTHRLASPAAVIAHAQLKLVNLQNRLVHATRTPLTQSGFALAQLRARLQGQRPNTAARRTLLQDSVRRMAASRTMRERAQRLSLAALGSQLELLNPQRTLERGYAIATDAKGRILRSPAQLRAHDVLHLRLAEGAADLGIATVQATLE